MTASSWAVRDSGFSEATIFYVFGYGIKVWLIFVDFIVLQLSIFRIYYCPDVQ